MTILADHEIAALCRRAVTIDEPAMRPMIRPYESSLVRVSHSGYQETDTRYPVISYGQTSAGYDLRCSYEWWLFKAPTWWQRLCGVPAIDPKNFDRRYLKRAPIVSTPAGPAYRMPPHSYALTHSVEIFNMPDDVVGVCVGKSTYARSGLVVNVTPLEPGWCGSLVIEVANTTPWPLLVYPNEGIAQILFHRIATPTTTYATRGGKYQNQRGVTLAKV